MLPALGGAALSSDLASSQWQQTSCKVIGCTWSPQIFAGYSLDSLGIFLLVFKITNKQEQNSLRQLYTFSLPLPSVYLAVGRTLLSSSGGPDLLNSAQGLILSGLISTHAQLDRGGSHPVSGSSTAEINHAKKVVWVTLNWIVSHRLSAVFTLGSTRQ